MRLSVLSVILLSMHTCSKIKVCLKEDTHKQMDAHVHTPYVRMICVWACVCAYIYLHENINQLQYLNKEISHKNLELQLF